jgi:endoglucanase
MPSAELPRRKRGRWKTRVIARHLTTSIAVVTIWLLTLVAVAAAPGQSNAASTVPAGRLALLRKGVNADNIVFNWKTIVYDEQDLTKLKAMGITHIRVPIDISVILQGVPLDKRGRRFSKAEDAALGLRRLDAAVANFVGHGFVVTVDPHPMGPVYRLPIVRSEALILQAADLLSSRYAGLYGPNKLFFEALDEPQYDVDTWNDMARRIAATIRKNAPDHTIIVGPANNYSVENFTRLRVLSDRNVVYAMHIYEPVDITHQGTRLVRRLPHYRFPNRRWTYGRLDAYMHLGIDWAAAHHVPLIMNEFGATHVANHQSRVNWLRFVRVTAETNGVGWAYWSYDGRKFGIRPQHGKFDPTLVDQLSR